MFPAAAMSYINSNIVAHKKAKALPNSGHTKIELIFKKIYYYPGKSVLNTL